MQEIMGEFKVLDPDKVLNIFICSDLHKYVHCLFVMY